MMSIYGRVANWQSRLPQKKCHSAGSSPASATIFMSPIGMRIGEKAVTSPGGNDI